MSEVALRVDEEEVTGWGELEGERKLLCGILQLALNDVGGHGVDVDSHNKEDKRRENRAHALEWFNRTWEGEEPPLTSFQGICKVLSLDQERLRREAMDIHRNRRYVSFMHANYVDGK